VSTNTEAAKSKYMSGNIRHLINQAIQHELANLPATLSEIKDPIQRLNFLTKLMPFVCAPIQQVGVSNARREVGEDNIFSL
jgi:hypothetical protein